MSNQPSLLFKPDLLNQDARNLAKKHVFSHSLEGLTRVKPLLEEAKKALTEDYRILATTVKRNKDISPAAEWLIDNFYIIQEQIVQIEHDFPIDFQKNLPLLISGSNKGLPRVYDLVHKLVVRTDNQVNLDNLIGYTRAYQEENPLKIGELWAIPIMLRFALIRQLDYRASRVLERHKMRVKVQGFLSELMEKDDREPGTILHSIIEWLQIHNGAGEERLLYVELARQLQTAGLLYDEERKWFTYRLRSYNMDLDNVLREEAQRQSQLHVSIQNAIITLRQISETKWQKFVEECSIVDRILRLDPMGVFSQMDSKTKNQYRSAVERLASYSNTSEKKIAEETLRLAETHLNDPENGSKSILFDYKVLKKHVGYYLLGEGYEELCLKIGYRKPLSERIREKMENNAFYYIGLIAIATLSLLAALWFVTGASNKTLWISASVIIVGLFPALELSVSLINRFFVFILPPRLLPRMKYKEGIPDSSRTMVVVPTLVTSAADVNRQLEELEITAMANSDPGLQFVLFSDFVDADQESKEEDAEILAAAENRINQLNQKYSSRYGDRFFLLHRKREWNPTENSWMGWERKRGKLEQFNALLVNPDEAPSFEYIYGNIRDSIRNIPVRFVLTLDADTDTPPDCAIELVQVASHPLNRAWYNKQKRRITKGYGIIQPRISISPDSAYKSFFSRIFSGNVGIDIYTTAVSDIYQDLFGEAIFTGKGIYDVHAFHTVLQSRFPENRILSHDLIESNYVRSALSTDIELFDNYPQDYISYCKRNHRWTRGDWQIARWMFGNVPSPTNKKNQSLNVLSRWKIFDNLRRSLNPFFLILFFITGWFLLPGSIMIWTLAALGILAFPIYVTFSTDIFNRPARIKWKLYLEKVQANLKVNTMQVISTLAILPHQAFLQLDAVARVFWRLNVSKKKLLEWTSSSHAEQSGSKNIGSYIRMMLPSVLLGAVILAVTIIYENQYILLIFPFALLWITSPYFAWYLSYKTWEEEPELKESDFNSIRIYARRTWSYFEQLVTADYSWLPPDNDQEDPPLPPVARTSPTNIGLALVSTQAAYELGYITTTELLDRLEKTINSLAQLDRYKGHFYNWYDIHLGHVLNPRYISTVDSGNLAAGLIVINQAVGKIMSRTYSLEPLLSGLKDTLYSVADIISDLKETDIHLDESCRDMEKCIQRMLDELKEADPITISDGIALLERLKKPSCELCEKNVMKFRNTLGDQKIDELIFWLESPERQIRSFNKELKRLQEKKKNSLLTVSPDMRFYLLQTNGKKSSEYRMLKRWQRQIKKIKDITDRLVTEMDYSFLYYQDRGLFSIGYNVEKAELDKGTYDLLASEARIASIIAIAKKDVPPEHWFRLSRRLTSRNENEFLLSWGGTTFEYLMPQLFTKSYPNTLLAHTNKYMVEWQREYAHKYNRPWGFSESAYNYLNIDLNYQYRAFGVPGLGMKRGLAEEYVIAPYASILAMMVDPQNALRNLSDMKKMGALGLKGFYDAVDFTPEHLPEEEKYKIVKTYMAHHHGMSMISLLNVLRDGVIRDYFHSDPRIKACELLLQERIPRGIPVKEPYPIDVEMEPGEKEKVVYEVDHYGIDDLDKAPPRVHLLSNGSFHSFVSHTGTGTSRNSEITLTGWDPDPTVDPLGQFIYIKDCKSGEYWSAFHQPVKRKPDRYDTWFHNGKVQVSRVDDWIETTTEVCVSPEYPVELRRITLTNYSDKDRTLELTSYEEVVLNGMEDHRSHPAFSKLFVQTDYLADHHSVIAWRRPRSSEESPIWAVHIIAAEDLESLKNPLQYETERSKFIGRGRSLANPAALDENSRLSCQVGNVADPILSLRRKITVKAGSKVKITFSTGFADSREKAEELADIFDNPHAVERTFEMSSIYNTVELDHIGISSTNFQYFQRLAGYMLYNNSRFRAKAEILEGNRRKQQALWPYGISGDKPIIVFTIKQQKQLKALQRLLKGHLFWKHRGLYTDLVVFNEHPPSYADELQEGIQQSVEKSYHGHREGSSRDIFLLRDDHIPEEDKNLIETVASVVLNGKLPNLDNPRENGTQSFLKNADPVPYNLIENRKSDATFFKHAEKELDLFNGYGGFSKEGDEYRILLKNRNNNRELNFPPAPWTNVVANSSFGFITTESGGGYSWSVNSRENKLSTWSNDPVLDPLSEACYIRDESENEYWSATPSPAAGQNDYMVTHGFGYSAYEHSSNGIASKLTRFVPLNDSVKITLLTLQNKSNSPKHLSLFMYYGWVMGVDKKDSARYIIQEYDRENAILFSRNYYNNEFAGRVAFAVPIMESGVKTRISYTTDRQEFIGRNCSLHKPVALRHHERLSNKNAPGGDPCAAYQLEVDLQAGQKIECIFLMGETKDSSSAMQIIENYRDVSKVNTALESVKEFWKDRLGRIKIDTPDASINKMMNGWLQYQNLACRMWSRTGFYQAGGAYGFRDQLQDAMAAFYVDPQITREQILLHAAHQFPKGDVLHWWHPPVDRGVRTRITDDRLWLPYVVHFYIESTGDRSILKESVPYIEGRPLKSDEDEAYLEPKKSETSDSLYEHCINAIDVTMKWGQHGLPLMGTGDWNDGMNKVGEDGKGESVWLGFFLKIILEAFMDYSASMGDGNRVRKFKKGIKKLETHLNKEGWDGKWYRRAFYDDGTPLGSAQNQEGRIDAISQTWAIFSGVASGSKRDAVLLALENYLISENDQLIRLLTPPFDKTDKNPGYIKGYIPGVRENGGQYTHAAAWVVKAFADSGMGEMAVRYMHMINPVNHALNEGQVNAYKTEPYVVAADIYGEPPLTGHGGWTWYTGSAGWIYRVILESILGVRLHNNSFKINPAISPDWNSYSLEWQMNDGETVYNIKIKNPERLESGRLVGSVDGDKVEFKSREANIKAKSDGKVHDIELSITKI